MEPKIEEIANYVFSRSSALSGRKAEDISIIRKRRDKFIWKIVLSDGGVIPKYILAKAAKPKRKNLGEIILYRENPEYLRPFFPNVYGVIKKNGFYWMFLEWLDKLPAVGISSENFKKPIELMASLHSEFYSDVPAVKNGKIIRFPDFKIQFRIKTNRFKLFKNLGKYMRDPDTMPVLKNDGPYLRNLIKHSGKILCPLLDSPRALVHGCFDYTHVFSDGAGNLRLIDWENFSFAPVTLDLVYLVEKSVDNIEGESVNIAEFRDECLNYYISVMKKHGVKINELEFKKLYDLTLLFKIITQFLFEELKKIEQNKNSNYNFYRNRLFALDKSLNLTV